MLSLFSSSSFRLPESHQSSISVSNTSVWDTMVSSPVQNLRQKLRGRPSYLDEGRSRGWKIQPQQILACLIFLVILISIGFAFLISYKHFNSEVRNKDPLNGKHRAIQFGRAGSGNTQEGGDLENKLNDLSNERANMKVSELDLNILLDDDVTIEDVEKMKNELEGKVNSPEPSIGDLPIIKEYLPEVEAVVLKQLADSVEKLLLSEDSVGISDIFEGNGFEETKIELALDNSETKNNLEVSKLLKRKSKNSNPLIKSVLVLKKSKVESAKVLKEVETKVEDIKGFAEDVVYPDDPTYRKAKSEERVRRDETEAEVVFGDKFRKYKDN